MNETPRFLDHAQTDAERIVASAAAVAPLPLQRDEWDAVMSRAVTARPSPLRLVPAFAGSLALGAVLVLALRPTPPPAPVHAELVATAGAEWKQLAPDEVSLQAGRLAVARPGEGRLRVITPDAVLETNRSRFLAEVTSNGTTLVVEEGEVILRARGIERVVRAGESLVWPPPTVIPAPLLERTETTSGSHCATATGAALVTCLASEAAGDTLDAQAALYELGALHAREGRRAVALETWRASLARFPNGVLEPEVRLAVLVELVRARKTEEAVAEAKAFEAAFPTDARADDVRSLRRSLEP